MGTPKGIHLALPALGSSARLTVSVAIAAALKLELLVAPLGCEGPPTLTHLQSCFTHRCSGLCSSSCLGATWKWQRGSCGRDSESAVGRGLTLALWGWNASGTSAKGSASRGMLPCALLGIPEDHRVGETFTLILLPSNGLPHPHCTYQALSHPALKWPVSFSTSQTGLCGFRRQAEDSVFTHLCFPNAWNQAGYVMGTPYVFGGWTDGWMELVQWKLTYFHPFLQSIHLPPPRCGPARQLAALWVWAHVIYAGDTGYLSSLTLLSIWKENRLTRMRRQVVDWEKIFAKHVSDKGSVSKIHRELSKLNSKKANGPT